MFTDALALNTELGAIRKMRDDDMDQKLALGTAKCEEFCTQYPLVKRVYCPIAADITRTSPSLDYIPAR